MLLGCTSIAIQLYGSVGCTMPLRGNSGQEMWNTIYALMLHVQENESWSSQVNHYSHILWYIQYGTTIVST